MRQPNQTDQFTLILKSLLLNLGRIWLTALTVNNGVVIASTNARRRQLVYLPARTRRQAKSDPEPSMTSLPKYGVCPSNHRISAVSWGGIRRSLQPLTYLAI
jgi:hypothetical protein